MTQHRNFARAFLVVATLAAGTLTNSCQMTLRDSFVDATKNTFLTGVNGLITMPADIVMETVDPIEEFQGLPRGEVTSRPFGLIHGLVFSLYRATTGMLDMVFAPFPFVVLSPEPRYAVVPGFEYEE